MQNYKKNRINAPIAQTILEKVTGIILCKNYVIVLNLCQIEKIFLILPKFPLTLFMKYIYFSLIAVTLALGSIFSISASPTNPTEFDLTKFRYQTDSKSVFSNNRAYRSAAITNLVEGKDQPAEADPMGTPSPAVSLAPSTQTGNIDAPNGELWYYTGDFVYDEIPPHDDVYYTERILRSWTFNIYDSKMELIGTIKDKMEYSDDEVRVPLCEMTPVATRNFFNTDDAVELIVALAVNRMEGGNNYRSLVYSLNGKKDADGDDIPVTSFDDLVGDVAEGPASPDGSDNFYISLMADVFDESYNDEEATFWDYLLAQKASVAVYGKAIDDNGPRKLFETIIPLIQLPGDQENISPMMSMRQGDDVVFSISYYKEPFYNRFDDPFSEDMTQREGNSLIVDLYKATETEFTRFSTTEIPVELDPMNDYYGNPTCLFSYFSVGSLRYTGDILFDAPGASADAPDFIVTRGNYQVSTDGITNSYFTYKNDGTLKNTLFLYADGTIGLGDLPGFEPQQLFVSLDPYGYLYNFVDLYSAENVTTIEAQYYYDNDTKSDLLAANVARFLDGDSYKYVFEMRYPVLDSNGNDILRFMYITDEGEFDHIDYVNMGQGVEYAMSFLATQAMAPHAYSTSDVPAYMFLVKRSLDLSGGTTEELMIAEAMTKENPEGKTLLLLGEGQYGNIASVMAAFATEDKPGRLFVYYYDSTADLYTLDIYDLPLSDVSGLPQISDSNTGFTMVNGTIHATGKIFVYSIDGRMAASATGSFDTTTLSAGVYLLSVEGKAYKFLKK